MRSKAHHYKLALPESPEKANRFEQNSHSLSQQQWRVVQALKVSGVCDSVQVMPIKFCHHFKRLIRATSTALNNVEYQ